MPAGHLHVAAGQSLSAHTNARRVLGLRGFARTAL